MTVSGTGTLVLAGTNNFSGGTTVTSGTVEVNGPQAVGFGILTITGTKSEVVLDDIVTASAPEETVSQAAATAVAADTGSVSLPLWERIQAAKQHGLAGGGAVGAVGAAAPAASPAAVPEPSTFLLLGVAALGLLAGARRRRTYAAGKQVSSARRVHPL